MALATDTKLLVMAAGLAAVGAWYLSSRLPEVATALPGIIADTGAGVAIGIGDVIGIPRTDETECARAIREGRTWDASFACPAGTFIGSVWDGFWK